MQFRFPDDPPAAPVARVAQLDDHFRLRAVEQAADVEQLPQFREGEHRRGDGGPEGTLQGLVGLEFVLQRGEGAVDGGAAGQVGLAGFRGCFFLLDDEAVVFVGGGGVGSLANGVGAEDLAEEAEGVLAEVGGWVRCEGEEEPAEDGVILGETHLEKIGKGVDAESVGGAVTAVLDEMARIVVNDAG